MKLITLYITVFFYLFIACNGQTNKSKKAELDMEENETEFLEKILNKEGYVLKQDVFDQKTKSLLGLSTDTLDIGYSNIYINGEESDYVISKKGKFIKLGQDLLQDLDSIEYQVLTQKKALPYISDFICLNKIIFNDDLTSILSIVKNKDLASDIVVLFNYEKNDILIDTAIKNLDQINEQPAYYIKSLLVYNDVNKNNLIREKLLKRIAEKDIYIITSLIDYLMKNDSKIKINEEWKTKCYAQLMNFLLEYDLKENHLDLNDRLGYWQLERLYNHNKQLEKIFSKNKFYDFPLLKEATNDYNVLSSDDRSENNEQNYIIQDPDGYTNLRKEKNTTSEVLQKVKSGEEVDVLDNTGDWWKVKTQEGKTGYIHKSRIKSYNHSVSVLRIYDRSDFNSFSKEIQPKGEVEYVNKVNGWDFIKVDGTVGYIPTEEQKEAFANKPKRTNSFLADDEPELMKKKGFWDNLFG
ncbi:SH3 domain-containing protein [Chryseobacterium sp. MMS23-Vi53]|uniref:SH3 domain-containing protein n=1 Tax=Chryseobacterium sp. MMS23-Vi53 TaxID=3386644 RepID=UPI0039E9396E